MDQIFKNLVFCIGQSPRSFWMLVDSFEELKDRELDCPSIAMIHRLKMRFNLPFELLAFLFQTSKKKIVRLFWESILIKVALSHTTMRLFTRDPSNVRKNAIFRQIYEDLTPFHKRLLSKVSDPLCKFSDLDS